MMELLTDGKIFDIFIFYTHFIFSVGMVCIGDSKRLLNTQKDFSTTTCECFCRFHIKYNVKQKTGS